MTNEYERLRLKNIADNKRILSELGLHNPFKPLPKVIKKAPVFKRKRQSSPTRVQKRPKVENLEGYGSQRGLVRRSSRLKGTPTSELNDSCNGTVYEDDDEDYAPRTPRVPANRPNFYGAVPDIPVGTEWRTRMQCCVDGVHRPTVAGIHMGLEGAYSLALSGGYEDDIDLGECFTYTGEGGRDLKGTKANPKNLRTAAQSRDQVLARGNLALTKNVETGNPVRVIRGYKLHSAFAPEEGYRYDGLYKVEKFWFTTGMSGFGVYKFALKRIDQAPTPWTLRDEDETSPRKGSTNTEENNQDEESDEEEPVVEEAEETTEESGAAKKILKKKSKKETAKREIETDKQDQEMDKQDQETDKQDQETDKQDQETDKQDQETDKQDQETDKQDQETDKQVQETDQERAMEDQETAKEDLGGSQDSGLGSETHSDAGSTNGDDQKVQEEPSKEATEKTDSEKKNDDDISANQKADQPECETTVPPSSGQKAADGAERDGLKSEVLVKNDLNNNSKASDNPAVGENVQ